MADQSTLLPKVVRGAQWLFLGRVIVRSLQFFRTLILAMLLSPGDFDLLALAFIIMNLLETISVTGYDVALIRMKGGVERYLDTAWTVLFARGIVMAGLLVLCAQPVAVLFKRDVVESVLYVFAATFVFRGMTNIGVVFFDRDMTFHKRFLYLAGGAIADVGVSIAAAIIMRNVWALVFGVLARDAVQCVLSYLLHPYRPRFRFVAAQAWELFIFGKWILIENIVCYLLLNVDQMLVGTYPSPALGLYMMAYYLSSGLIAEISGICSEVLFPAYAKLQDEAARLRAAYLEVLVVIVCVIAPLAAGIFALAPECVAQVLGEKWLPMVPVMTLLSIWGLERGIVATTTPVLRAVNRPEVSTIMNGIRCVGMVVALYPLTVSTGWGMTGTAVAVLIGAALASPFNYVAIMRILGIRAREFFGAVATPILSALFMAAALLLAKSTLHPPETLAVFLLMVSGGAALYFGTLLTLDRVRGGFARRLMAKVVGNITVGRTNGVSDR